MPGRCSPKGKRILSACEKRVGRVRRVWHYFESPQCLIASRNPPSANSAPKSRHKKTRLCLSENLSRTHRRRVASRSSNAPASSLMTRLNIPARASDRLFADALWTIAHRPQPRICCRQPPADFCVPITSVRNRAVAALQTDFLAGERTAAAAQTIVHGADALLPARHAGSAAAQGSVAGRQGSLSSGSRSPRCATSTAGCPTCACGCA